MASGPKFENIGSDHPVGALANAMSDMVVEIAGRLKISQMDVAVAHVNAAAYILADSKDMPRDKALARMDDLRIVMEATYELRKVEGHS